MRESLRNIANEIVLDVSKLVKKKITETKIHYFILGLFWGMTIGLLMVRLL